MARSVPVAFDFPASYEIELLHRIDRRVADLAYGFPGATLVDPEQDVADAPIFKVTPYEGSPWIGVFYGSDWRVPPAAEGRLFAWPDEKSFCVIYRGGGMVVRADNPTAEYEIEMWPITSVLSVVAARTVVFSDFTNLAAYGVNGRLWESERLATDEVKLVAVREGAIEVTGFVNGRGESFLVELATGTRIEDSPPS